MGFKSKEELQAIADSGVYKCGVHDFMCDMADTESIKKHHEEAEHYIKGHSPCQRCGTDVRFDKLIMPKEGREPGAFCDKCKAEIVKELNLK